MGGHEDPGDEQGAADCDEHGAGHQVIAPPQDSAEYEEGSTNGETEFAAFGRS